MDDFQNLNVRVPREVLLMVRDIKRAVKKPREQVIETAIRDMYAIHCGKEKKEPKKLAEVVKK